MNRVMLLFQMHIMGIKEMRTSKQLFCYFESEKLYFTGNLKLNKLIVNTERIEITIILADSYL